MTFATSLSSATRCFLPQTLATCRLAALEFGFLFVESGYRVGELWRGDDGLQESRLIARFRPHAPAYYGFMAALDSLTRVGTTIYFAGDTTPTEKELWRSDGSAAGTVLVKDLNTAPQSSSPYALTRAGDLVFFAASGETGRAQLWRSDATESGTFPLLGEDHESAASRVDRVARDAPGPPVFGDLVAVGRTVFFSWYDDSQCCGELWKSDGTTGGTQPVANTESAPLSGWPPATGSLGRELWALPIDEPNPCRFDCDTDGDFDADDLFTIINLVFARAVSGACPGGDANLDGVFSVEDLVAASNTVATDCGAGGS